MSVAHWPLGTKGALVRRGDVRALSLFLICGQSQTEKPASGVNPRVAWIDRPGSDGGGHSPLPVSERVG